MNFALVLVLVLVVEVLFTFVLEMVGAGRPLIGLMSLCEEGELIGAGRPLMMGFPLTELDGLYTTWVEVRVIIVFRGFLAVVDDEACDAKVRLTVFVIVVACIESVSWRRGRYAAAAYWPASRAQVRIF